MSPTHASAEIDLSALSHNLQVVKEKTRNIPILAVVKAGAYGHGAVRTARHLLKNGVQKLGVAFVDEALELRDAGIRAPIIVFFERGRIDHYLQYSLTPVLLDLKHARAFSRNASRYNRRVPVHMKIDTGMGRVGMSPEEALPTILEIAAMKNLRLEGLMSHLSDADMSDKSFSMLQLRKFRRLLRLLQKKKIFFKYAHIANSSAILRMPQLHLDMVRPGIMLYGYGPSRKNELKPVLRLKSKVLFIKKVPRGTPISYGRTFVTKKTSIIATISIGYADGYSRKLSNCGEVLINGKRAPVAGRVCMDTVMVDATGINGLRENAEAVLIGCQGSESITAQDIADRTGTIPYEVLTSVGKRVKRVYINK